LDESNKQRVEGILEHLIYMLSEMVSGSERKYNGNGLLLDIIAVINALLAVGI